MITVLFCDLRDSTGLGERLQPETFRRVLTRYVETARPLFEAYGATVYPPSGDAIMAAFGIPRLHGDDALRAVRAAVELREALPALNQTLVRETGVRLALRIGINTGEVAVEVGAQSHPPLHGDVLNIAARLEQAAAAGEILLGAATWALVRELVSVEPLGPLPLRGRSEPVPAYRLLALFSASPEQPARFDAPMIGREQESAWLRLAYQRADREQTCHLVTVLGSEGVGKSRLVQEFSKTISSEAIVLRGSCLSYGRGMTFWPLAVPLRQLAGIKGDDPPEEARARLAALVGNQDRAEQISARVSQLLGLSEPDGSAQESGFWELRRLLETLASRRPTVLILEDLHWAEPTLLDLVEYVADGCRQAPLLIVCVAREVLLGDRPTWGGGKPNAASMLLSPLTETESERLVDRLVGDTPFPPGAKAAIARTAEGNPLFIEELVESARDQGSSHPTEATAEEATAEGVAADVPVEGPVPPRIRVLLEARLDRLDPEERNVLERAAVVGVHFSLAAVLGLSDDLTKDRLAAVLETLVRKGLVRPYTPDVAAGEAFRFRHGLIRETVYNTIPLDVRAALHERLAELSELTLGGRAKEIDEITAYHLNEAYRYRTELGPADEPSQRLARRAGELFAAAGRRAALLGDVPATVSLLNQAVTLLPEESPLRLEALLVLADALGGAGELARATGTLETAIRSASEAGDTGRVMHAVLGRLVLQWYTDLETTLNDGPAEIEQAIEVFTQAGDDAGLSSAWRVLSQIRYGMGQSGQAREAIDHAIDAARRADNQRLEARARGGACWIVWVGPTPVVDTIAYVESVLAWAERSGSRRLEAHALRVLARAHAMRGNFAKARELLSAANLITVRLGEVLYGATDATSFGFIELLADDYAAAERGLRHTYETLARFGVKHHLARVAGMLARVLLFQDRVAEAEHFAKIAEENAASKDVDSQVKWRRARARALAIRSRFAEAERLAREEVALAATTDWPDLQAEAHLDLAAVLRLAGRAEDAHDAAGQALDLYQRKGNAVGAQMALALLDDLRGGLAAS